MTLRPLPGTRRMNVAAGCVIGLMGLAWLDIDVPRLVCVLPLPIGGLLAIRGYRLRVHVDENAITVHGMLRTRVIPRAWVVAITDFPAVQWRTASGRGRWTPITALDNGKLGRGVSEKVATHNRRGVEQLREWAAWGRPPG
jgi:hypothetical protein